MNTNYDKRIAKAVLRLRLSQMIVNEDYKEGKFKIPIHLAFGHEAIAVTVNNIMKVEDRIILTHRNIAYNLARLGTLKPILHEYYLKPSGIMSGKTGSMNLINPSKGIIYSSSILGNNWSVAVGVAMSQKISSSNGITIVLGGDGSIEEGSFHESLIMFKSLNLSGLIIIENNEWSMATRINERRCDIDLSKFTESFNIKYANLESKDPYQLIPQLEKLRNYSLSKKEPVCIEIPVTTLGSWRMKTPEFPDGKYINYHAGPAPTIDLKNCQTIINKTDDDPVYVLSQLFSQDEFETISNEVSEELKKELE